MYAVILGQIEYGHFKTYTKMGIGLKIPDSIYSRIPVSGFRSDLMPLSFTAHVQPRCAGAFANLRQRQQVKTPHSYGGPRPAELPECFAEATGSGVCALRDLRGF